MGKWIAKAIVQKAISFLPAKDRINFLFQKYVTRGVLLTDEHLGLKLMHARDHLQFFREENGPAFQKSTCLELGSGWYPVIPVALFLSGFNRIISLDIRPWMNQERMLTCIRRMVEWEAEGRLQEYLTDIQSERWEELKNILKQEPDQNEICRRLGLELLIRDARSTGLESDSIEYLCSNNTFEHIYEDVLEGILAEFKRIAAQPSIMSHFVDLSDHFAHMDSTITIYNFLRYNSKQWKRIDNDIQPQNRLRWSDYLAMYKSLDLPCREALVRPGSEVELATVPLAPEFQEYTAAELAISHGYLVTNFS